MVTQVARGVLAEVAGQLRAVQRDAADEDAAVAHAFGMVAARAQDLAGSPGGVGGLPGAGSSDPWAVLARVWGLLRSRPLVEYPPGVVVLAWWLLDLCDVIGGGHAPCVSADVSTEEWCHVL